ncbi:shikimate dehydrogenase [Desulfonatronospira sp.]|uniref:shikimate dehydrogenase n=1 Tax=Desulfonatronospira sp. TaxID=1962951 RepID=UPI0025B89938|nr:shikimate dehydrogenase [Desulfonatronospira sp.]
MYQAYGVLGLTLGHSLSPFLHNCAFQAADMKRVYLKWEIQPGDLGDFMKAVRILPLSGASVTIPYKEDVMKYLDYVSPEAADIGAVNTIYWDKKILCGANTDCSGFMSPIKDMYLDSALVLGAGGASRAVLYGLKRRGISHIYLTSRSEKKALAMAGEFNVKSIPWDERHRIKADLLVHSTPLGTAGDLQELTPWDSSIFPFEIVYDLVYNPLQTRLLQQARAHGAHTLSGLSMFVHQALQQFETWTGQGFDPGWAEDLLRRKITGEI